MGPKDFFGSETYLAQKCFLGFKKFMVWKNFGPKTILSKNILSLKIFGLEIVYFCSRRAGLMSEGGRLGGGARVVNVERGQHEFGLVW